MSAAFKVGEVAILCNARVLLHLNGMECTVIGPLQTYSLIKFGGELVYGYHIEFCNGETYVCTPDQLRKKRHPRYYKAVARQAMLDCLAKAKQPQEATA